MRIAEILHEHRLTKKMADDAAEELMSRTADEYSQLSDVVDEWGGRTSNVEKAMSMPSFQRFFKQWALEKISISWDAILPHINGKKIRCWRALTAPIDWEPDPDDVGIHWSWDRKSASSIHGSYEPDHVEWLIEADIAANSVNWDETLAQNANPTWGDDEREITLLEGEPVDIISTKIINRLQVDDPNRPLSNREKDAKFSAPSFDIDVDHVIEACRHNFRLLVNFAPKMTGFQINRVLKAVPAAISSLIGTKYGNEKRINKAISEMNVHQIESAIPKPWSHSIELGYWTNRTASMYRTDLSIIPAEFRTPQIVENCFKRNYTEMSKYPDLVTADIAVAVVKYCGAMAMPYIPEHFFREKYAPMIGAALMYQRGENVLPDYIPKEWWPASYVKYLIQRRVIKSLSEVPSRLLDRADIRALLPSD